MCYWNVESVEQGLSKRRPWNAGIGSKCPETIFHNNMRHFKIVIIIIIIIIINFF
jgi:hypothetical protein